MDSDNRLALLCRAAAPASVFLSSQEDFLGGHFAFAALATHNLHIPYVTCPRVNLTPVPECYVVTLLSVVNLAKSYNMTLLPLLVENNISDRKLTHLFPSVGCWYLCIQCQLLALFFWRKGIST